MSIMTDYLGSPRYKSDDSSVSPTRIIIIDRLVQDCSNSIANARGLLQSCSKPSIYFITKHHDNIDTIITHLRSSSSVVNSPVPSISVTQYHAYVVI